MADAVFGCIYVKERKKEARKTPEEERQEKGKSLNTKHDYTTLTRRAQRLLDGPSIRLTHMPSSQTLYEVLIELLAIEVATNEDNACEASRTSVLKSAFWISIKCKASRVQQIAVDHHQELWSSLSPSSLQ
eukprot:1145806-Pelagomonas_calceolata.AAC.7